jgi:hypothetical protein
LFHPKEVLVIDLSDEWLCPEVIAELSNGLIESIGFLLVGVPSLSYVAELLGDESNELMFSVALFVHGNLI